MADVGALEDLGEVEQELATRHRADDRDVEEPVVETGRGRDAHPARVGRTVAHRDQPGFRLHRLAVDRDPEPVGLVDREGAQHGRDIEGRARQPSHGVGPAVRLRVEARRGHARVPAPVHPAEVDDAIVAARDHVERRQRALRVVAEHAGEVVPGPGRRDRKSPAGVGGDTGHLGDQAVAATREQVVALVGRRTCELGRRTRLGGDVQFDPGRPGRAFELGKQLLGAAPTGHRIDDRRPRHGRKLSVRRG